METKKTFCRFCHAFCGLEADVEGGKILAIRGDRENAVTQGYSCSKGRAELERLEHPDRLLSPRKRVEGKMVEISPQLALDEIAQKLGQIIEEYGPEAVAVYVGCGGHRTSTGGPWFVRKWLDGIQSPRLYTSMTIDSPSLYLAGHRFFGSPMPANIIDIDNAEVVLFVGTNPVASHQPMTIPQSNPMGRVQAARKRGMKLIVIDPRCSDSARLADIHLQVKPGEDATLLAGMIKIVIDRTLYDEDYVQNYVSGFDALSEALQDFDLDYVSRRSGVPAELIEEAARVFATAQSGAAQSGTGLHMARHQNLGTQLVLVLNALCGRIDRKGGLARNVGVLNFEIPEGLEAGPGFAHFVGPEARVRGIRGTFSLLAFAAEMPTNTLTDEILEPGEGQIRALIVNGGNPALVLPDSKSTLRALEKLDLLVVNDLFMSATAKYADYVLAVKHPFERTDLPRLADFSYPFPFSQYAAPLVEAGADTLEEWEIFWEISRRLGAPIDLPGIGLTKKPSADEILDALFPSARIALDEVRKYPGGHVWGDQALRAGGMIPNLIGHPDKRMAAGHPEVLAELRELRSESVLAGGGYEPGEDFDFRMITYRMKEVYCTQGQNLPSLRAARSYNPALLNPRAMEKLGVEEGDLVVVDSGFGKVEAVVEASDGVQPGVVALAFGWGDPSDERGVREKGTNVQTLIPDDVRYDPITGLALQSAVPVNIYARAGSGN